MRQLSRLRPFADLYVDLDLLDPGRVGEPETHVDGLSDLYSRFDDQFSDDGVRRFFQLDAETGDCPPTQDVMPMRHDMRNTRIIENRGFSSDHREGASQVVKV